jgi:hypothetical protein
VACPSDSYSVAWSDSIERCYCNPGYRQTQGHDACIQCNPGCDLCPANSNSPQESALITDCTCNAGATASDGATCVLCPAGEYKAGSGSAVSTDCPGNSSSAAGSTDCACNVGYTGPNGGPCAACSAGKYKDTIGNGPCIPCTAGTFEAGTGSASCQSCLGFCQDDTTPPGIFNPPELARKYPEVNQRHGPGFGSARSMLDSPEAWICDNPNHRIMTMNLGKFILVTDVVIQARKTSNSYVTEIEVQYSTLASPSITCNSHCQIVNSQWISFKSEAGNLRFFPTSTFANQEKSIPLFQTLVVTQYIKITVHAVVNGLSMRAGVTVDTLRFE